MRMTNEVITPETGGHWLDGDPFRREGLWKRIGPFAVVAFLAEASIALPPGPASSNYTWMSAVLLFATVVGCLLPWERLPSAANVIVPILYVGSVLTLNLAAGGSTSGVGIVILMPLVWTALYHRPYQSAIVVASVLVYQLITSLIPVELAGAIIARRLVFWFALATLVSFATHQLRSQIRAMLDQRQELIEQRESALVDMTRSFERLRLRERESLLLIELGDTLQSSATVLQARGPVKETLVKLFEGGAVSVLNVAENLFETTVLWGRDGSPRPLFPRSGCWALQKNQLHYSDDPDGACGHSVDPAATLALCVPMIAHGDTIGVLQVYSYDTAASPRDSDETRANLTRLSLSVGEQLGMALANFRLRESLREQAIRDPLTNLFNRRYMEETFHRELSRAARDHVEIGVMQIDIDHFKQFNDAHGHDVGDVLLRAFANLLFTLFRDSDVPCRYGGEEFTLILINSSLDETEARARGLQQSVLGLRLNVGHDAIAPPPTLSIGVASYPAHGDSAEALIRAADQALYVAKSRGRNMIVRADTANAIG
jgi:diguanylate cyclase (GGDEF)-like protein